MHRPHQTGSRRCTRRLSLTVLLCGVCTALQGPRCHSGVFPHWPLWPLIALFKDAALQRSDSCSGSERHELFRSPHMQDKGDPKAVAGILQDTFPFCTIDEDLPESRVSLLQSQRELKVMGPELSCGPEWYCLKIPDGSHRENHGKQTSKRSLVPGPNPD